MAAAFKRPMGVDKKFWRVGMLSRIPPSIMQNANNGLDKKPLYCVVLGPEKRTYVVPRESPYVNKYTRYNTMKRFGRRWHHSQQQHRYAFNIKLAMGIGAMAGLYCSMGCCETVTHNNVFVLPPLTCNLDDVFRALEKEAKDIQQDSAGFRHYCFIKKIIQEWAEKRISETYKLHTLIGRRLGRVRNVDLGTLLRYAAQEGSYIVCRLMITYAKFTGHKLSIDFSTLENPYTSLDYAAVGGGYRVVKLLLKNGARSISRKVRRHVRENDSIVNNLLKEYKV